MQPLNPSDSEQPQADKPVEAASDTPAPMAEASTPSPAETVATPDPVQSTPEPATPVEPAQPTPLATPSVAAPIAPVAANGKPKNKRMLLIGGIIAAVVLIGGGVGAYTWYQNPDKVITDALFGTVDTKHTVLTGDFAIDSKNAAVTFDLTAKGKDTQGTVDATLKVKVKAAAGMGEQEYTIDANSAFIDNGDIYFKVSNIDKALNGVVDAAVDAQVTQYRQYGYQLTDEQIAAAKAQAKQQFSGVVNKINNQWIKVSADDLKKDDDASKASTCISDEVKKLSTDKKLRGEVSDLYKDNRFVVVKESLGTKDGSLGYVLDINKDAAKKFGDGFKNTTLGKALVKCDEDIFKDSDSATSESKSEFKDTRFELWVDQWSHKVTNIVFKTKYGTDDPADISANLKYDYKTQVNDITVPEGAKSINELQAEIKALMSSAASSVTSSET